MKVKVQPTADRTQVVIATEMLESLNQALGGMEQLSLVRRDPRFLLMRDGLAALKNFCIATFPRSMRIGERPKKILLT